MNVTEGLVGGVMLQIIVVNYLLNGHVLMRDEYQKQKDKIIGKDF